MLQSKQHDLQQKIAEIIHSSRSGEELFFTDAEKAAKDILAFILAENASIGNETTIEFSYVERGKAA